MNNIDVFMGGLKERLAAFLVPFNSFLNLAGNFWTGAIIILTVFLVLLLFCFIRYKKDFSAEIKKTRTLSVTAMLIAVNVVLTLVNPLQNINQYLRISFDCVTIPVAAAFFGPVTACFAAIISDIISYLIKPSGAFLLTYTICMGIKGLIFGMLLYKEKISFLRIFVSQIIVVFFVHIILNSIALAPTVQSGLAAILPARIIKNNIVFCAAQATVAYLIINVVQKYLKKS